VPAHIAQQGDAETKKIPTARAAGIGSPSEKGRRWDWYRFRALFDVVFFAEPVEPCGVASE
jgi:hypothetical protein